MYTVNVDIFTEMGEIAIMIIFDLERFEFA